MPPSATDVQQYNGNLINDLAELLERKERQVAMALYAASEAERITQETPGTKEYEAVGEDRAKLMLERHPWDVLSRAKYHLAIQVRSERARNTDWERLQAHTDAFFTLALAQNQLEG